MSDKAIEAIPFKSPDAELFDNLQRFTEAIHRRDPAEAWINPQREQLFGLGERVIGIDPAHGGDRGAYCMVRKLPDGCLLIEEFGTLQRRVVRSTQRKRKLRRRGESIGWDAKEQAFVWYRKVPS